MFVNLNKINPDLHYTTIVPGHNGGFAVMETVTHKMLAFAKGVTEAPKTLTKFSFDWVHKSFKFTPKKRK